VLEADAPSLLENIPAIQETQVLSVSLKVYFPAGQKVQDEESVAEYIPAGQGRHGVVVTVFKRGSVAKHAGE
jgi:hypothetical protein